MARSLLLILLVASSCLTLKYQAQKVWLFSKTQYIGNVPVDRDGKALKGSTEILSCFLEVSKNSTLPQWQAAWYKGVKYAVNVLEVNQDSIVVGKAKNTRSTIAIKPGAGMQLIQLELTEQDNFKAPKVAGFVLEGISNKKTVYLTSNEPPVELAPVLMQ